MAVSPLSSTFRDPSAAEALSEIHKIFLCHPCNDGITPFGLKCKLCNYYTRHDGHPYNNQEGNAFYLRKANAFHKLTAYKGEPACDREVDKGWYCHSICGYMTDNAWVWGADKDGNHDNDQPIHHYQMEMRKREDFPKDKDLKIVVNDMEEYKDLHCPHCDYDGKKLIEEEAADLKAGKISKNRKMCMQCSAWNEVSDFDEDPPNVLFVACPNPFAFSSCLKDEFPQLARRHGGPPKRKGEDVDDRGRQGCRKSFHVGCARYAVTIIKHKKTGGSTKYKDKQCAHTYFYPGAGREEVVEDIKACYCVTHAKEVRQNILLDRHARTKEECPSPEKVSVEEEGGSDEEAELKDSDEEAELKDIDEEVELEDSDEDAELKGSDGEVELQDSGEEREKKIGREGGIKKANQNTTTATTTTTTASTTATTATIATTQENIAKRKRATKIIFELKSSEDVDEGLQKKPKTVVDHIVVKEKPPQDKPSQDMGGPEFEGDDDDDDGYESSDLELV